MPSCVGIVSAVVNTQRDHRHNAGRLDLIAVSTEIRSLDDARSHGLFTVEPVAAGSIVAVFGGRAVHADEFRTFSPFRQRHALQIGDDIYLTMIDEGDGLDVGDYINHSCDPSLVLVGDITLAARRDLAAGEQLTYDYATSDSTPYDEFECECHAAACRGKVTGEDWMDPELQRRYAGHFSPYLQRRILDALR